MQLHYSHYKYRTRVQHVSLISQRRYDSHSPGFNYQVAFLTTGPGWVFKYAICLRIYPSTGLPTCLPMSVCLSACSTACLPTCLCAYPNICLSTRLYPPGCQHVRRPFAQSVDLPICRSLSLYLSVSLCLRHSLCLPVCLPVYMLIILPVSHSTYLPVRQSDWLVSCRPLAHLYAYLSTRLPFFPCAF